MGHSDTILFIRKPGFNKSRVFVFIILAKVIQLTGRWIGTGNMFESYARLWQNLRKDFHYIFSNMPIACFSLSNTFTFPTISMLSNSGGLTL
jgi:hypothetical protein